MPCRHPVRTSGAQAALTKALEAAKAAAASEASRAAAATAGSEARIREVERACESRLERFKERTSRENDEMRRRVRAEAEAESKRVRRGRGCGASSFGAKGAECLLVAFVCGFSRCASP